MRIARGLLATVVMSTVFMLSAPSAGACSCDEATDQAHFDLADVVFEGMVVGSEALSDRLEVWTFDVTDVYKGSARQTQFLYGQPESNDCGPDIAANGTYIVFATVIDGTETEPGYPIGDIRAGLCDVQRSAARGPLVLDPPVEPVAPIADAPTATTTLFRPATGAEELTEPLSGGTVLVVGFVAVGIVGAVVASRIAKKSRES